MQSRSIRSPIERRARWAVLLAAGLVTALAVTAAVPPVAAAAPESDKIKRAREHFRKGDAAFKAERYDEAYMEFEAGFTLSNKPAFLLNMAGAERRRGDLRKARAQYKRYLLMEPESKLRGEVEAIIQEIDVVLAAEASGAKTGPGVATAPAAGTAPPPVAPSALAPVARPADETPPGGMPTIGVAATPPPDDASGPKPLWKRWEVWAGAGAVVVAAVALTVILTSSSYEKDGSLGTLGR